MIKLNGNEDYRSFLGLIGGFFGMSQYGHQYSRVQRYLSPEEYYAIHGVEAPGLFQTWAQAPFQVFVDMAKDIKDTFKPYKGPYQVWHDFLQPFSGLLNILRGLTVLIFAPAMYAIGISLAAVIGLFLFPFRPAECFFMATVGFMGYLGVMMSWLTEGVNFLIRGITQLAATPLTWFVKMPLRGIITAAKGMPKLEETATIQDLVQQGFAILENNPAYAENSMKTIMKALHIKLLRAVEKGQGTAINDRKENVSFPNINNYLHDEQGKLSARNYLNLFVPPKYVGVNLRLFTDEQHTIWARKNPELLIDPNAIALPANVLNIIAGFTEELEKSSNNNLLRPGYRQEI